MKEMFGNLVSVKKVYIYRTVVQNLIIFFTVP